MRLTDPQRNALAALAAGGWFSPAGLGSAMGETTAARYRAQVQGRRGATMGNRLVTMGLAKRRWASGFGIRYAITDAGRKALHGTPDRGSDR